MLAPETYAYCRLNPSKVSPVDIENTFALIKEKEAWTLITTVEHAKKKGLPFDGTFKRITCQVESSLEAVGLTAALSEVLKQKGCSANVVAGFYHDHILVPESQHKEALLALKSI